MKNERKNRQAPNEAANGPNYTAQVEQMLRQPKYSAFIEDIQQKLQADPQYLRNHREEAYREALLALERSGDLKDIQPSEVDVERALTAIVGRKNR